VQLKEVQVGDRVRIVCGFDPEDVPGFVSDMRPLVGREGTVAGVGSWVEVHVDDDWQSDGEPQHWSWPAKCLELVRSSPGQRLARIQAAVGRLAATASGPDRLLQLQRRMVRATKAAADLVVEEVAKMGAA
jgi:hypothetical protein